MSRGWALGSLHQSVTRVRGLYEELTGLSRVFESQELVEVAKGDLTHWRSELKDKRQSLHQVQEQILHVRNKLDGVPRADERFLALATREHELLKQESEYREKCSVLERREREEFVRLYEAVSESHEQERAYANRTKYWSVIGSVTGTLIGVLGSSLLNWRRNMQIREVIQEQSDEIKSTGREQAKAMVLALDKQKEETVSRLCNVEKDMGEMVLALNRQKEETVSRLCSVEKDMGYFREELTKQSDLLGHVTGDSNFVSSIVISGMCGVIFGVVLSKVFS